MPRARCPTCSSTRTAEILYGEPSSDPSEDVKAERMIVGGCCPLDGDPTAGCFACGARWGSFDWETFRSASAPRARGRR